MTYKALTTGLLMTGFPPFWVYARMTGRYRKGLKERLGFVPPSLNRGTKESPIIWIHAVSLGEIKVAEPIIEGLKTLIPGCAPVLSTTTEHGRGLALELFGEDIPVLYSPIDVPFAVRKALARVRPDVMVFLETEIWPAWLTEARKMGIKTALINGRISLRTMKVYQRMRVFFRDILKNVDAFSMIMEKDARRIISMGADPTKIEINGNAKYDFLSGKADPAMEREMREILHLQASQHVIVAGSTRGGEEAMILEAYEIIAGQAPGTLLIIAPRHINRVPAIETLLGERGIEYQLRTELDRPGKRRTASVVILNTFGELFKVYSVGTINFCGASLVPLGGQNPLEPAAWGKSAFYGPFMDDFMDARALLDDVDAGIEVSSPEMFAERALWFIRNQEALKKAGERARQALMENRGAAQKHAEVIARLIGV